MASRRPSIETDKRETRRERVARLARSASGLRFDDLCDDLEKCTSNLRWQTVAGEDHDEHIEERACRRRRTIRD